MIFSHSCGTELEPCITRCVFGMRLWIALMRSMARMSPVGGRVNLLAPWLGAVGSGGAAVARRRTRELVGAVAGADGDGERVDLGLLHEVRRLVRIGQELRVIEL